MNQFYCTNCGAILNNQLGFNHECGTWVCTECGEQLMDDDVFEGDIYNGIAWYCDKCSALLNRQCGFSDRYGEWVCDACGHSNGITKDQIIGVEKNSKIVSNIANRKTVIERIREIIINLKRLSTKKR